ncbi:septum formation inhibitor Maf [Paenibacillus psychroresistens]|uniref:dTTP/UTP pyrophosphatase n=1 Tax=Paenibacillus psychroresistens TaxID=1778678 RepID=A0A6B8RGU3_9BACL|nr:Maf family protein [Paenibacillus psychroresistens]QGQ95390.1 septum formation inhibitor Maf [Paenibacillus psychroresistens]
MLLQETRTLLLASSSPRRQELIRTFQLPVQIEVSHVDESYAPLTAPNEIVEELALRKAQAVANNHLADSLDGVVVGSDTIVVFDNQILNKPVDDQDAMRMLMMLQSRTHQVFSGVACIDLKSGKRLVKHRMTEVTMRELSVEQISRYIASGEPRDKAGAYGIQGIGATIVVSIQGCYFNVVGLPLSLLSEMLKELGVDVL